MPKPRNRQHLAMDESGRHEVIRRDSREVFFAKRLDCDLRPDGPPALNRSNRFHSLSNPSFPHAKGE